MNNLSEDQQKVMTYGLAYLLNHTDALRNGMAENLPESDVLTPNEVVMALDQLVEMHREEFDRWGLGTYLGKET